MKAKGQTRTRKDKKYLYIKAVIGKKGQEKEDRTSELRARETQKGGKTRCDYRDTARCSESPDPNGHGFPVLAARVDEAPWHDSLRARGPCPVAPRGRWRGLGRSGGSACWHSLSDGRCCWPPSWSPFIGTRPIRCKCSTTVSGIFIILTCVVATAPL